MRVDGKKKQIMMAQGAIARGGRNDPLKKFPGARLKTVPNGWPELDSLERACWGGAKRSRSVDGQVRGGLAMLPAEESRQPGCFQAQTVQAPFVFGSAPRGWLTGGTLAREHPTIQLRVYAQAQLLARPSRRVEAARVAHRHTPGAQVGSLVSPARALRREGFSGNAKTYTGESAARPPGRGDGADVGEGHAASPGSLTGILPSDVRQISRGSNQHTQKAQLTIFCTQVAPTPVSGRSVHWELAAPQGDSLWGPETLIGKQPRRPIHGANSYLHSPRWRKAAENNEMPRALKGSNDLAKAVGALTLAARAEEDSKANALGLGAAKAKKEEEHRKAEDQRRRERKEAQRQLDLETAAATAATTQEAAQLHAGLQGIRGTAFESRNADHPAL
jgi:hypothetical protein